MEYKLKTEAVLEDGREIKYVEAPFDVASALMNKRHITSAELAMARMQFPKEHSLNEYSSYTRAGFVYKRGESPIRAALSPLIDSPNLAALATEANRSGRYFTTENTRIYDTLREMADSDIKKKNSTREKKCNNSAFKRRILHLSR